MYVRVGSVCIYCTAMSVNDGTCGVCEGESACHPCLCQCERTSVLTLRLSLDSFFVVCVCVSVCVCVCLLGPTSKQTCGSVSV